MTTLFNLIGPIMVWLIANVGPWVMVALGIAAIALAICYLCKVTGEIFAPQKQEATPDGLPIRLHNETTPARTTGARNRAGGGGVR